MRKRLIADLVRFAQLAYRLFLEGIKKEKTEAYNFGFLSGFGGR